MESILGSEAILVSILGATVTGIFGIAAYTWQVHKERETNIQERRKDLYEKLLRSIFELMTAKTGSERSKCVSNIEKNWLFASDDVLKACYEFLKIFNEHWIEDNTIAEKIRTDQRIKKEFENILAVIFLAMRKDINRITPTAIDDKYAMDYVKIYYWGILDL